MEPTPTLRSELKRGVSPYNLAVAFLTAVLIAAAEYVLSRAGFVPVVIGRTAFFQALVVWLILFGVISLMHIVAHAYFGWRFERGVAAFSAGDRARALNLLAIAERRGMDHYDEQGSVRRLLQILRSGDESSRA